MFTTTKANQNTKKLTALLERFFISNPFHLINIFKFFISHPEIKIENKCVYYLFYIHKITTFH